MTLRLRLLWRQQIQLLFPFSTINAKESPAPTSALPPAYPAGTKPSYIPNAPGLPDISGLSPNNFPALDKAPPVDSPQVQQWIKEVQASGIAIPDIPPNVLGGCLNNTAAAANKSTCWWTCGGCTRDTDITSCPDKLTWGLSYDDGPSPYTTNLLSYLGKANLTGTFFVVGSRVISRPTVLQQEYMLGHQLSVHTWSHTALTTQSDEQIIAELGWTKLVIQKVLGVTPNTMRPPYGDIDDRVRAIAQAMDLTPILWTTYTTNGAFGAFDTLDFNVVNGLSTSFGVVDQWEGIMNTVSSALSTGFIVLEHDLYQQAVELAMGYILPDALARKLNITSINSCLHLPMSDAYVETNDNSSHPPPKGSSASNSNSSSSGSGSGSVKSGAVVGAVARMDALALVAAAATVLGAVAQSL